ncbi:MAG: hypothetical protein R3B06_17710 [Kofleriaceae bacterium]
MRVLAIGCVLAVACGGDGPALRLVPVNAGPCGRPDDARALLVTPLGDFVGQRQVIELGAPVALAALPADTRALAVEVLGPGGELAAIGRTGPFTLGDLVDGDELRVAMAPPDGACPAGALTTPRDGARAVRVGDGVLVVGGAATAAAELYDPTREQTTALTLPPAFVGPTSLVGAGVAALGDGRAVVIGGVRPGFTIYTPGDGFGPATLITETRAHHVALALDERRVLVAAGCGVVDEQGACEAGNLRRDSRVVDLVTGDVTAGPALGVARLDGTGALELAPDGRRFVVLVGGVDGTGAAVTEAERLDLAGGPPTVIAGAGAALAPLDGGALLTAFAPPGTAATATAAVIVPGQGAARPAPALQARATPVLVTQDDGAVLALGGGAPLRYRPSRDDWSVLPALATPIGGAPAALRWDDGSVLVFGGTDGAAQPTAMVQRFRPRLLGPDTGTVTVVPGDGASDPPLTPLDPAAVDRAGGWQLAGGAPSWAIVGGPRAGLARLEASVTVPATGLVVVTGFVDAADHDDVVLVPGEVATIERVRGGAAEVVCRGAVVPAAGPAAVLVELGASTVRVVIAGATVASCALDDRRRGGLGIGSRGLPVVIGSIAISR